MIVSAGGEQKKFTVDKNTKHLTVEFDNLKSGNYNVKIDFKGNDRYTAKTLNFPLEITQSSKSSSSRPINQPISEPSNDVPPEGRGYGNNSGGIGTGSGDANVTGSGNGTYNGKISLNGKGFSGDLGSQGSGHGEKSSYEITKNIKKFEENANSFPMFLILAFVLLFLSFICERRENKDSEEY